MTAEPPPLSRCGSSDDEDPPPQRRPPPRDIPESTLSALRGILVSSLPRQRTSDDEDGDAPRQAPPPPAPRRPRRHVTFDRRAAGTYAAITRLHARGPIYTLLITHADGDCLSPSKYFDFHTEAPGRADVFSFL